MCIDPCILIWGSQSNQTTQHKNKWMNEKKRSVEEKMTTHSDATTFILSLLSQFPQKHYFHKLIIILIIINVYMKH